MNKFKKLGLIMALFFSFGVISQNISYINAQEIKEEKTEVSFYVQPYMQVDNYKVYLSDPIRKKGIENDKFSFEIDKSWAYNKDYLDSDLIVPKAGTTVELKYTPGPTGNNRFEVYLNEIWLDNNQKITSHQFVENLAFGKSSLVKSRDGQTVSNKLENKPDSENGTTLKLVKSEVKVSASNLEVIGDANQQEFKNLGNFANDNYPIKRNEIGEYNLTSIFARVDSTVPQIVVTYYYKTDGDEHEPGTGETTPPDPSNPGNGNGETDPNNPERPQLPETGGSEGENPSEPSKPQQPQLPETGGNDVEKPQQPSNEGSNIVNKNEVPKLDKNKTNEKVKAANKVMQQQNKNKLNQEDSLPTTGSTSLVFGIIFSVIAIVGLIILNRYYQK